LPITLLREAAFGDFQEKTPKRTWLCAKISPVWYALPTQSKAQKTQQIF